MRRQLRKKIISLMREKIKLFADFPQLLSPDEILPTEFNNIAIPLFPKEGFGNFISSILFSTSEATSSRFFDYVYLLFKVKSVLLFMYKLIQMITMMI